MRGREWSTAQPVPTFCPHLPTTGRYSARLETSENRVIMRNLPSRQPCYKNHDFFSGSGSSYVIGKAEATEDDDWDF